MEVTNEAGIEIDFGPHGIVIDEEFVVDRNTITYGKHSVKVYKDYWYTITTAGITTLAQLKIADKLYPYNQRYLVEGFTYPVSWATTEEKIYRGFDTVAEYYMTKVSIFDMLHNVPTNDYSKFAIDLDAADSGASKAVMNVFVVKVDENNADFTNEQFVLKFKSVDTLFKYLRLKAVLSTEDATRAPYLSSYRLKLAS